MNRFACFMITLVIVLFISCNNMKIETNKEENTQKSDYLINEKLSLNDYSAVKGYFPKEGFVPTAEMAFQIAESILSKIYGKETIESEKPFSINLENDVWMIEGYLEQGVKGGVAYMEIQKSNGEILKVIHTE